MRPHRARLIEHAEDPKRLRSLIEAAQKKADPKSGPFEKEVISHLMQAGFRIMPQFKVGAYTIDMVAIGSTQRVAIECDGDKFHPAEKLYDDMQRQMVLERLGWTFIRIRGGEFFRAKVQTINRVISQLDQIGLDRLGSEAVIQLDGHNGELKNGIIRRAFEFRQEWKLDLNNLRETKSMKNKSDRKLQVILQEAETNKPSVVQVELGDLVYYVDLEDKNDEKVLEISYEDCVSGSKIENSALAKFLLGKNIGERVTINLPENAVERVLQIVDIQRKKIVQRKAS